MTTKSKLAFFSYRNYDKEHFNAILRELQKSDNLLIDYITESLTEETVIKAQGATAVCVFVNDTLNATIIATLKSYGVKYILHRSMGFDRLDIEACKKEGLRACRVFNYGVESMAEHALVLAMVGIRNIDLLNARAKQKTFVGDHLVGRQLGSLSVGVIGTGKIGKETARIMKPLFKDLYLYDAYPDEKWAASLGGKYLSFEECAAKCNVFTLHVPSLPSTVHMFDKKFFDLIPHNSVLVNTARGDLIETKSLLEALNSGKLGRAMLDCVEGEKGNFYYNRASDLDQDMDQDFMSIVKHEKVCATSHSAFLTEESLKIIARYTLENLFALLDGREPDSQCILV